MAPERRLSPATWHSVGGLHEPLTGAALPLVPVTRGLPPSPGRLGTSKSLCRDLLGCSEDPGGPCLEISGHQEELQDLCCLLTPGEAGWDSLRLLLLGSPPRAAEDSCVGGTHRSQRHQEFTSQAGVCQAGELRGAQVLSPGACPTLYPAPLPSLPPWLLPPCLTLQSHGAPAPLACGSAEPAGGVGACAG